MAGRKTREDLAREIGVLADLPRGALAGRWGEQFDRDIPKGTSRRLIVLAIAYEMQRRHFGGLSAAAKRQLRASAGTGANVQGPATTAKAAAVSVGSRFVREWNGRNHVVDAVENGFLWNGRTYRSLSAVAKAITGAQWSGPRFFGLVTRGK